jgi:hypothetical protein
MGKCPFFLVCDSPSSKWKNKWACDSIYSHKERMKMCIEYVRAVKRGVLEIPREEIFIREEVEKSGLV